MNCTSQQALRMLLSSIGAWLLLVESAHAASEIVMGASASSSTSLPAMEHRSLVARQGESCGGLFGSSCDTGLTCVEGGPVVGGIMGGRCLPVECLANAIRDFQSTSAALFDDNTDSMDSYLSHQIFSRAGVTPEELAISRANEARSDETFRQDSTAMQKVVAAMNTMDTTPFRELQYAMNACSSLDEVNYNGTRATTPGTTMYYGFHIEGGALYDGEFSVLVTVNDGEPNLTFLRGCFGGGGIGFDVSAVIGMGYTGTKEDLMGCSALLTDNELGIGLAFGVDVGIGFNGVTYLDFTLGLGLTGEGLGIGLCGNWPQ